MKTEKTLFVVTYEIALPYADVERPVTRIVYARDETEAETLVREDVATKALFRASCMRHVEVSKVIGTP